MKDFFVEIVKSLRDFFNILFTQIKELKKYFFHKNEV